MVCAMPRDAEARAFAKAAGLNITTVSWEDNARYKDSALGPCISDMTLLVEGQDMPLIKNTSNFEDESWDVEIEKVPIVVGNHNGTPLKTVTLKEYLGNLRSYLHAPSKWPGTRDSLLEERDRHVICSAQACFLPLSAAGEANFRVSIFNYQSRPEDPAVLAIVASANGTSAQVLDSRGSMELSHNNNGQRTAFVGKRLSDHRRDTGSTLEVGAPMTADEQSQNLLLVIQVPLKQKPNPGKSRGGSHYGFRGGRGGGGGGRGGSLSSHDDRSKKRKRSVDVESAMISIGRDEGEFDEIKDIEIQRDERFPIRVTLQYYKATSNGDVNAEVMSSIAEELQGARTWAVAISSLVTETTNRTTEHQNVPDWWPRFWKNHCVSYGEWSANAARDKLFANRRFVGSKLNTALKAELKQILAQGPTAKA